MTAVAVSLQAAGLNHAVSAKRWPGHGESLAPVRPRRLEVHPILGAEVIKDQGRKTKLLRHAEDAFALHDGPGIAHAAAIADGDRARAHSPQALHQGEQRVVVRGARRRIGAVEIGLQEEVLPLHGVDLEQFEGAPHAECSILRSDERHSSRRLAQGDRRRRGLEGRGRGSVGTLGRQRRGRIYGLGRPAAHHLGNAGARSDHGRSYHRTRHRGHHPHKRPAVHPCFTPQPAQVLGCECLSPRPFVPPLNYHPNTSFVERKWTAEGPTSKLTSARVTS